MKKSTETLSERLDKAREENDDLRFQVSRNQRSLLKKDVIVIVTLLSLFRKTGPNRYKYKTI